MFRLQKCQYLGINRQQHALAGLTIVDTVYNEKVFNGWHWHECAHITFVLDGGNRERRNKTDRQLDTGTLVFYHSGELHCNDHTLFPSRNLNLEITHGFLTRYGLDEQRIYTSVKNGRFSAEVFMRLFYEAMQFDEYSADATHMLFLDNTDDSGLHGGANWVVMLRDILNDRWNENPSLQELADETGVHPITISKHFHRYFGCTLGAYMRKLKIKHSLGMIRSCKFSLSEITYLCGFSDQSHFIRTFKSQLGVLPKQFRQL